MSPTQMRSFYAVGLTGSFTAAARLLNVSQPTVTTQVKALEDLHGVELFFRHGRGAELTEVGRELFQIVLRIVANQNEARDYLNEMRGLRVGQLRVGAVGPYQVSEILARFTARYPLLDASVHPGNSRTLQEELRNYRLDVAVIGQLGDLEEFQEIHYSRPEIVIVVNRAHPWVKRRFISIRELQDERMILREDGSETRRVLQQATRQAGVTLTRAMEFGSRDGLLAAVARGIGIGAVSEEEFVDLESLHRLSVTDADMYTDVHVICLKERREARVIKAFMEVAAELVKLPSGRRPKPGRRSA